MTDLKFNDKRKYKKALSDIERAKETLRKSIKITDSISEKNKLERDLRELEKTNFKYYNLVVDLVNLSKEDQIKKALTTSFILVLVEHLNFGGDPDGEGYYISCNHKRPFGNSDIYSDVAGLIFNHLDETIGRYDVKCIEEEEESEQGLAVYKPSNKKSPLFCTEDDIQFILDLLPDLINPILLQGLKNLSFYKIN